MRCLCALLMTVCLLAAPRGAGADMRLVMFEQTLCEWCETWNEEIGPIYPKTPEGKRAPLWRVDIHDSRPAGLEELRSGRFTPTFVLISDGAEIGRIRGYPGEDFFWGMLAQLIKSHDETKGQGGTPQ